MPLDFVEPSAVPTLNILLYSGPGTGKTTAALTAPGPVLYLNAEGPNAAMFARRRSERGHIREVTVKTPDVLADTLIHVGQHPDQFATVVLDTIGSAYLALLENAAGAGRPTLPQHGDVTTMLERFCRHMRDLPVNFVVLAHELTEKDDETGVIERVPFTGTSKSPLGGKLEAQMDVVAYCGRMKASKDAPWGFFGQLFNGGGRHGKDRTSVLGDSRPLDLREWIDTYRTALGATATREVKAA